jgi:Ca2+-binding EF-hand superfamily protein
MKNYSTFITRKSLNKMIKAHDLGLNLGNAIDQKIIDELNSVHLGNEGKFISNLNLSSEAESFLDNFITDFKTFEKTGEGSVFAENYINSL